MVPANTIDYVREVSTNVTLILMEYFEQSDADLSLRMYLDTRLNNLSIDVATAKLEAVKLVTHWKQSIDNLCLLGHLVLLFRSMLYELLMDRLDAKLEKYVSNELIKEDINNLLRNLSLFCLSVEMSSE